MNGKTVAVICIRVSLAEVIWSVKPRWFKAAKLFYYLLADRAETRKVKLADAASQSKSHKGVFFYVQPGTSSFMRLERAPPNGTYLCVRFMYQWGLAMLGFIHN